MDAGWLIAVAAVLAAGLAALAVYLLSAQKEMSGPARPDGRVQRRRPGDDHNRHRGAPRRGNETPGRRPRAVHRAHPEDDRRGPDAARRHRRRSEEPHRAGRPGRRPAGYPGQQTGARRLRRGPARRPGAQHSAALAYEFQGDAGKWPARRLPDQTAQPAGADRRRRQVPARELSRIARGQGRCRHDRRRTRLRSGHLEACRRYRGTLRRSWRDRRIGAHVPAVRGGLRRASRPSSPRSSNVLTRRASGSSRRPRCGRC